MSKIEKMKRYIERTKMNGAYNYCLVYSEAVELLHTATDLTLPMAKAKGFSVH